MSKPSVRANDTIGYFIPKHNSREQKPIIQCHFGVMATSVLRRFISKLNCSFDQLGKWLRYLGIK